MVEIDIASCVRKHKSEEDILKIISNTHKFNYEISTIIDIGLSTSRQAHVGQWMHGHVRARPIGDGEAGNCPRPRQCATHATTRLFAHALYYTNATSFSSNKKCSKVSEADNWQINGRIFAVNGLLHCSVYTSAFLPLPAPTPHSHSAPSQMKAKMVALRDGIHC